MLRLRSGLCLLLIAVAVSGWLLAGCGESRQDALNKLAAVTSSAHAATGQIDAALRTTAPQQTKLHGLLDERVAAAVYAHRPCLEMQLEEAEFLRERHSVAPALRYRDEPAAEIGAQKELDHASDLYRALANCAPDEKARQVFEALLAVLKQKATDLRDAFEEYLKRASSSAEDRARSDVEADAAELK
jgi:hypothetical protein